MGGHRATAYAHPGKILKVNIKAEGEGLSWAKQRPQNLPVEITHP